MDLGLTGKNVVVTGASKGIGKAIALGFAAEGANVALCARKAGLLKETEAEVRAKGVKSYADVCDIGNAAALEGFLDGAKQYLGSIDVLVNNASALAMGDEIHDWEANFNLDLLATVRATQKVIPWMSAGGGGSLIFISTLAALESGWPVAYSAIKAALNSYSKSLAVTLAPQKIRANAIAPGPIEFEGGAWNTMKESNRARYDAVMETIPWGRMGTPEEVADVAVFLASDRARWVNGTCLLVDGGQHKGNF